MINLDSEIVATRFDGEACYYTVLRDGKRYTARVPLADLDKFGNNKAGRRNFLSGALETRLTQPADVDPVTNRPTVPVIEPLPTPPTSPMVTVAPGVPSTAQYVAHGTVSDVPVSPTPAPAPQPEAPAASPTTDPPYRPW